MPIDMNSTTMRAILGAVLLVVGLAVGWFGHKALNGAAGSRRRLRSIRIGAWPARRPRSKDGSCEMQQDVLDSKTRNELARLSIFRLKGDNTLIVTVPLQRPARARSRASASATTSRSSIQYETCNGVGCIVRVKIDDALAHRARQERRRRACSSPAWTESRSGCRSR